MQQMKAVKKADEYWTPFISVSLVLTAGGKGNQPQLTKSVA
jgi:hypothetical protein